MHRHDLQRWQHDHHFGVIARGAERRTRSVVLITAVMMVIEIAAGTIYGSMALLADGWHMATHVAAFGITLSAYQYARRHARSPRFSFGTGKVSVLGGFASAVALAIVALYMGVESLSRFFNPHEIHYREAIVVAVAGLAVNVVCGVILHERDDHADHAHAHAHADHNLRAAYFHVLADALTSVLAIAALTAGKYSGWVWLDPLIGLVGAGVITRWALGLLRETSSVLLDANVDGVTRERVRDALQRDGETLVSDLHLWHVGAGHVSASISLVTAHPREPSYYKALLSQIPGLSHVLIEVNACPGEPCAPRQMQASQ